MPLNHFKQRKRRLFQRTLPLISFLAFISSLVRFTIYAGIIWWRERKAIQECSRFTIAYVTNTNHKSTSIYYRHSILGKSFQESWGQKPRSWKDYRKCDFAAKNFLYQRILIKVSCPHPEISQVYWAHSIPEWYNKGAHNKG